MTNPTRDEAYAAMAVMIRQIHEWVTTGDAPIYPSTVWRDDDDGFFTFEGAIVKLNRIVELVDSQALFQPQSIPQSPEVPSVLICSHCGSNNIRKLDMVASSDNSPVYRCQDCGVGFIRRSETEKPKTPISDAIYDAINEYNDQISGNPPAVDATGLWNLLINIARRIQSAEVAK